MEENKNKPIDISGLDLEKVRHKMADAPALMEFAHTIGGAVIRPEDQGKIKSKALMAMRQQTDTQLDQLYQQMKLLVEQAKTINERIAVSERIYMADMRFEPLIGHTYYLYAKENGKDWLSMISPDEWGRNKPFESFIAKVRMLADHTWEVIEQSI